MKTLSQGIPPAPPSHKGMSRKTKIGMVIVTILIIAIITVVFDVFFLQRGQLEVIDSTWNDNHPLFGSPYVHLECTIFNSGSSTAGDVQLVIRIYDGGTLLKTETMNIGNIAGKTYKNISIDIQYSGYADRLETSLQ